MSTPHPYQQPHAYPQHPPGAFPPYPGAQQPPFPPPAAPTGTRKPVSGWLWGLGGAVVASAVWAATLFATGALDGGRAEADFAGHQYQRNLCGAAPLDAFRKRYKLRDGADRRYTTRQEGLDESYCSRDMEDAAAEKDSLAHTYVSTTARWHKASDPSGEFASRYMAYRDQSTDTYRYTTIPVTGFGDEAFLVTEKRGTEGDALGGMTFAVRDGWFTFEMQWSWFGGGPDDTAEPPTAQEVREMLEADTRAALADLRKG